MRNKFCTDNGWTLLFLLLVAAPISGQRHPLSPDAEALTVRTWKSPSGGEGYPEMGDQEFAYLKQRSFSVAFSGGGTRSATATWGQLRGLHHLGWLDNARYISAISGGAWVAVPYTFLRSDLCGPDRPCPEKNEKEIRRRAQLEAKRQCAPEWPVGSTPSADDRFLQPYRSPGELTDCDLGARYVSPLSLARDLSSAKLFRLYLSRLSARGDETYSRAIGKRFLQSAGQYNCQGNECPPGISHPKHSYVAGHGEQVAAMLRRSPSNGIRLRATDFVIPRKHRPFLIVGSTLLDAKTFVRGDWRLFPVEMTPLYVGTPQALETAFRQADRRWILRVTGHGWAALPVRSLSWRECHRGLRDRLP